MASPEPSLPYRLVEAEEHACRVLDHVLAAVWTCSRAEARAAGAPRGSVEVGRAQEPSWEWAFEPASKAFARVALGS